MCPETKVTSEYIAFSRLISRTELLLVFPNGHHQSLDCGTDLTATLRISVL